MGWPEQVFKWLGHGLYRATLTAVADGEVAQLLTDAYGRLRVVVDAGGGGGGGGAVTPSGYARALSANKKQVKAGAGSLVQAWGFNDGTQTVYLQFFASLAEPNSGDVPLEVFRLPPGGTFSFGPDVPLPFTLGLWWKLSTTPATLTVPETSSACATVAYL